MFSLSLPNPADCHQRRVCHWRTRAGTHCSLASHWPAGVGRTAGLLSAALFLHVGSTAFLGLPFIAALARTGRAMSRMCSQVWWEGDQCFYPGLVALYDPVATE